MELASNRLAWFPGNAGISSAAERCCLERVNLGSEPAAMLSCGRCLHAGVVLTIQCDTDALVTLRGSSPGCLRVFCR